VCSDESDCDSPDWPDESVDRYIDRRRIDRRAFLAYRQYMLGIDSVDDLAADRTTNKDAHESAWCDFTHWWAWDPVTELILLEDKIQTLKTQKETNNADAK
jgi:hypothetical protein